MKIYGYFRSSAAYRVRIAMNLKGSSAESTSLHLVKGQQRAPRLSLASIRRAWCPRWSPTRASVLTQSLAIIEWLEETRPEPPLLPVDAAGRARVRGIALAIACDIHPLNNLRVLNYLTGTLGVSDEQKNGWYRYWVDIGFEALEKTLAGDSETGRFCHGDAPTLADVCLVPQVANARRFKMDLAPYPTIVGIDAACQAVSAFADAAPERQPDAF